MKILAHERTNRHFDTHTHTDDGSTSAQGELITGKKWQHRFLDLYIPMGGICCHGNRSSDLIWPKTKQLSSYPNDASDNISNAISPLVEERHV